MLLKRMSSYSLAALLVLILVATIAYGGISALDSEEMAQVTGQTGITMDISLKATSGYLALQDYDGLQDDPPANNPSACVTFGDFWANDGAGGPLTGVGWKIDIGRNSNSSFLIIEIGQLTAGEDSGFGFDSFKVGTGPNLGDSIGSISLTNVNMAGSTIRMEARD